LTTIKTNLIISPTYFDSINDSYIYYLIKRASTFSPLFRSFFFNHLNICCPLLHKPEFVKHRNSVKNVRLHCLYDEILEKRTFLTLKQRCRLLIKESINKYPLDIKTLIQLPLSLQYYLSFDFLNPNFVHIILDKLNQVNGRIKPSFFDELQFHEHGFEQINGHNDWEDQIPEDMDYEDEDDDNDDEVVKSFCFISVWIFVSSSFRNIMMIMEMLIFLMKKDFIQIMTKKMNGDRLYKSDILNGCVYSCIYLFKKKFCFLFFCDLYSDRKKYIIDFSNLRYRYSMF
jgi:hypothetical protein